MRAERSGRKRVAITAAARSAFLREGFAGTSMDVVAAESGVSKQTVYAHFGSKENLFVESVADLTSQVAAQLPVPPDQVADVDQVRAWLVEYGVRQLRGVLAPEVVQLRRLVIAEAERFPEIGRAFFGNGVERSVQLLAAAIARFAEAGLMVVDDAAAAAHDFNWLLMGRPINEAMLLGGGSIMKPRQQRRHAERAVRVFLAACAHLS